MASEEGPISNLQRLELEHAQHDQGTAEDYQVSRTLTTDQSTFNFKYMLRLSSAVSSIAIGTLAAYWGFSPPAAILTFISEDLGDAQNASLFSIVWTAACAASIVLFGRLSDKFGRRYFMMGASVIGIIGGIIACKAKNMNTLIGANVLLGLSGGVMTCYGLTAGEICPNRYKLLGITLCVIPNILPTGFGAYLCGSPLPWTSARILCLVILGGVTLIAFVLYEIYSGVPNPLVPMYFFKDVRGFDCLVVICGVSGISYVAPSIIWPSQVASIYGLNATSWQENAWLSTTIAFGIIGGTFVMGPLFAVIKHVKWQVVILAIVVMTFSAALASSNQYSRGQSAAFSFLTTFPAGVLELIPVSLVQMEANDADLGTVFAILFLVRTTLGSIFATIYIAILDNKLPTEILAKVPAAALAAGLPKSSLTALLTATATGTAAALKAVPGMTTEIQVVVTNALLDARASAYSYIYYASIPVNLCAVIAALCLRGYDHLLTSHVPRQIYNKGKGADTTQAQAADIEQPSEKGVLEEDSGKKMWREVETAPSE